MPKTWCRLLARTIMNGGHARLNNSSRNIFSTSSEKAIKSKDINEDRNKNNETADGSGHDADMVERMEKLILEKDHIIAEKESAISDLKVCFASCLINQSFHQLLG